MRVAVRGSGCISVCGSDRCVVDSNWAPNGGLRPFRRNGDSIGACKCCVTVLTLFYSRDDMAKQDKAQER